MNFHPIDVAGFLLTSFPIIVASATIVLLLCYGAIVTYVRRNKD
jgi:hypothetical protein